ncbi:DUF2007 domain-containing protein [Emcibacter sp. SYSU 3D8]|uniref:putative signal transducing protein n=1 Tax=Emcibacter sp. SYSU 3D8 TaxID=3133969 RepID=UPI0031FE589D
MKEVLRTNDPVLISVAQSLLKEAGIETMLFDGHTSVLEGSIGAIQRRLMVIDEDETEARGIIADSKIDE